MDHILSKLTSGRWLWTMAACLAFVIMVVRRDLSNQEALSVISLIVTFYFVQQQMKDDKGGKGNP